LKGFMQLEQTIPSVMKQRGRRAVVSIAAVVALVLGTVGVSAAAGSPKDGNSDTDADNETGAAADAVYEPCSANFGLGKVVEIVVEVDGSVPTPPLTFPDDVQVVTTFDPGSGPVTCIPEPVTDDLWANQTYWGYLGIPAPVGNYVFLPFDGQNDSCTGSQTMNLVGHPAMFTVTVGQAIVPPTPAFDCSNTSGPVHDAAAAVLTAPELAAFDDLVEKGCDEGTGPSADLQDAADALVGTLAGEFLANFEDASAGGTPCQLVVAAYDWFAYQTIHGLEVDRQAVFDLTTPVSPPTTPTSPVAPPAAVVVTPHFTG
jgi:hypothetical protein